MSNTDPIQKKRDEIQALREEIRERRRAESAEAMKANEDVQTERLDREIVSLKAELAAMDQRQAEVEAVAAGEKPPAPPTLDEMTVEQLQQQPEYFTIEGRGDMNKEQLLKAIKAVREGAIESTDANRTNPVNQEGDKR